MRRISASPLPQLPASTTSRITSTSAKLEVTLRFISRFSAFLCVIWKPGVSTKMYCASAVVKMPWMRWRVVCAFFEVMLTLAPTRRLVSVDLPTLGRPITAR